MKAKKNTDDSSRLKLAHELFTMTWPMLFGILAMLSFQLVDSVFIGQLGVLPLAAQGFTLPMQMVIIGLQVGLGIATTAIIARALGASNTRYAKQLGGLVIMIGSIGMAGVCFILWLLRRHILALLSAPDNVAIIIDSYWPYWLISVWVGALSYFYSSVARANGNTMLPGVILIISSLCNLILDPLFIFTLGLGLNGAAIATILSFALGIVIIIPKVSSKNWLSMDWSDVNISKSVSDIGHIMGPAMVSQLLPSISSIFATKVIAGFGSVAVAAWALGSRVEFFVIISALALTMSMPPMVARLLGAKKTQEIRQLVSIACRFLLGFQFLIAVLLFVSTGFLPNLMTSDNEVAKIVNWHLMLIPISLGALGVCMLMVSVSNALGKSYTALSMSALRLFAFFLPCIWIGAELGGLIGLFIGASIGNILAGLSAWFIYLRTLNKIELTYKTL